MATFLIPEISKRLTIVGKNGSGKTQAGSFILSHMPFDQMPFVIFDFKREGLFAEIPGIRQIDLTRGDFRLLNQPGLFVVRPTLDQVDETEKLLWYIWDHEYCGIYIDEGYMIGKSKAFIACLTQGRSKNIPTITLTQRPAWITKFAFSEADYFMIFRLTLKSDRDIVQSFIDASIEKRLPKYYSYWYDVNEGELVVLRPVPSREQIISAFNTKLAEIERRQSAKTFV